MRRRSVGFRRSHGITETTVSIASTSPSQPSPGSASNFDFDKILQVPSHSQPLAVPSAGTAFHRHNSRFFRVQLPSPVGQPALAPPTGGNALRRHGPRRPQLAIFSSSTSEPCRPTGSGSADGWQCPPPARPSTATTGEFFKFNFRALSANRLWLRRRVAVVDGALQPLWVRLGYSECQLLALVRRPAVSGGRRRVRLGENSPSPNSQ